MTARSFIKGLIGALLLLGVYFLIVSLVSGWPFAVDQFSQFWYFIVGLSAGFGIQVGLYAYLKSAIHARASKSVVAVSGTTSAVAMISCCAHYLVNIVPLIGVAGVISLVGQYQIEFFWLGFAMNVIGITYIASRIVKFSHA